MIGGESLFTLLCVILFALFEDQKLSFEELKRFLFEILSRKLECYLYFSEKEIMDDLLALKNLHLIDFEKNYIELKDKECLETIAEGTRNYCQNSPLFKEYIQRIDEALEIWRSEKNKS